MTSDVQFTGKTTKDRDLSYELVEAQPVHFDVTDYDGGWDFALELTAKENASRAYMPVGYCLYPLGKDFRVPDDFRKKLNTTTIIKDESTGEYYLVLTVRKDKLQWEICESYINLGYYPPACLCRLPIVSGRGDNGTDSRIVKCCNESLRTIAQWNTDHIKKNEERFRQSKKPEVSK